MQRGVPVATADADARTIRTRLLETRHDQVALANPDGTLLGIVTSRSVLGAKDLDPVRKLVRSPTVTVHRTCALADAIELMMHYNLEFLPVVDRQRHFLGLVTRDGLVPILLSLCRAPVIENLGELNIGMPRPA